MQKVHVNGQDAVRIALEKDTLDVWRGGEKIETEAGFTEEGSEQVFTIHNQDARILGKYFHGLSRIIFLSQFWGLVSLLTLLAGVWNSNVSQNRDYKCFLVPCQRLVAAS